MTNDIEILYEDNDVIVCKKPAGMAVQSANLTVPDMESLLKSRLKRTQGGGQIYVIHRLDQPVEGIIVFARNKKAAASLSRQAQAGGGMNKVYRATVYGLFPEDKKNGELRDYLIKDSKTRCAKVVSSSENGAKEAILRYEVITEKNVSESGEVIANTHFADLSHHNQSNGEPNHQTGTGFTRYISTLQIKLLTGRYHQIRAQFSNMGFPLLGDQRYGSAESNALSQELGIRYVALCACKLSFIHPSSGKTMNYEIIAGK